MHEYWLHRHGGSIDTVTYGLPQTWRHPDGRGVDGLPGLSDAELLALGWGLLADALKGTMR